MKMKTRILILPLALGLASLLAITPAGHTQTPIFSGHLDIGLAFEDDDWDLHVHDEENDIEYSPPSDALLVVGLPALGPVPAGPLWSFLGTAGSDIWILPQVENEDLLFLGLATEEIAPGLFIGNTISLTLKGVSGPGHSALYDTDAFGDPIVFMNTRAGIDGSDMVSLPVATHLHYNWAFSAPGDYILTFEAGGTLVADSLITSSGDVEYLFQVVPEPSTLTLLALGSVWLAFRRRR